MKFVKYIFIGLIFSSIQVAALSEPVTPKSTILGIRYIDDFRAYVTLSDSSTCSTNTFSFYVKTPSGRAMYATLLSALTTGRQVALEVNTTTGCTGWGSDIMGVSVY